MKNLQSGLDYERMKTTDDRIPFRSPGGEVGPYFFWLGRDGEGFYGDDEFGDTDLVDDDEGVGGISERGGETREQECGG